MSRPGNSVTASKIREKSNYFKALTELTDWKTLFKFYSNKILYQRTWRMTRSQKLFRITMMKNISISWKKSSSQVNQSQNHRLIV